MDSPSLFATMEEARNYCRKAIAEEIYEDCSKDMDGEVEGPEDTDKILKWAEDNDLYCEDAYTTEGTHDQDFVYERKHDDWSEYHITKSQLPEG